MPGWQELRDWHFAPLQYQAQNGRSWVHSGQTGLSAFSAHIGDVKLKAVHLTRFNSAGEFVEIEKLVRPVEGAKALGNAMGSLIGPQIKALRAAV